MSLTSTTNRVSYAGDGTTVAFSFPYYFLLNADLVVALIDNTTSVITSLVLGTDYTLTGAGVSSGGTVTMTVSPAAGKTVLIYRDPSPTQQTVIVDNDALPANVVEQTFDKFAMVDQRLKEMILRSIRLPDGFVGTFNPSIPLVIVPSAAIVTDATGQFLTFGVSGSGAASVSSVGLSAPSIFSVANSPVTAAGTLALTLVNQSANTVFAGPTSGSGLPTFRALVAADLPTIALTGDVTGSASGGSVPLSIANNAVTNAKLATVANNTVKGNVSGGSAAPTDLTAAQLTALVSAFVGDSGSGGTKGAVPSPASGDAAALKFLKADGTWATPAGAGGITALTSDVTASGSGSVAATIAANAVTNAKAAQMATNTIKGNNTGSTANSVDLTVTQATAMLNAFVGDSGSGGVKGLTPAPASGDAAALKFLKADGTWAVPAGGGGGITALTGDVTASGTGSVGATIASNAVTNAKAAQMATNTFKGNNTGSTANAVDMTAAQAAVILPALVGDSGSGGTKGLCPPPSSGDAAAAKFLKADSTWAVPQFVPNRIINSAFDFWQRGTSTTAANAATAYQADRWYVKNSLGTNGVLTFAQVTGVTAGSKFGASVKVSTAPTALQTNGTELYHVLENQDTLPILGQVASVSAQIKALGNVATVGIQFFYATTETKVTTSIGSEQSVSVNTSTFSLGSLLNQTLTSATITTSGVVGVRIRILTVSTGNTYDLNNGFVVEQVQMNAGTVAMPFARISNNAANELQLCQRYYEKSYDTTVAPATSTTVGKNSSTSSGTATFFLRWSVAYRTKRADPTFTVYSVTGASGNVRLSNSSDLATSQEDVGMTGASMFVNRAWTAGDFIWHHWTADAEI